MVEVAFMVLGQSVSIAVHEAAFALDSQKSNFLPTAETSLPVDLLLLGRFKRQLLHLFGQLFLGECGGCGSIAGQGLDFGFLLLVFAISVRDVA